MNAPIMPAVTAIQVVTLALSEACAGEAPGIPLGLAP